MRAIHAAVFDLRQVAVVTAVYTKVRIIMAQQFLEVPPVEAAETVILFFAVAVFVISANPLAL